MQYTVIGDRTLTLRKVVDTFVPFLGPGSERREAVGRTVFVGYSMSVRETASLTRLKLPFISL